MPSGLRLYLNDPNNANDFNEPEISQSGALTNPEAVTLDGAAGDTDALEFYMALEQCGLSAAVLAGVTSLPLAETRFNIGDVVEINDGVNQEIKTITNKPSPTDIDFVGGLANGYSDVDTRIRLYRNFTSITVGTTTVGNGVPTGYSYEFATAAIGGPYTPSIGPFDLDHDQTKTLYRKVIVAASTPADIETDNRIVVIGTENPV